MKYEGFTPGPWYVASTGNHQGLVISEATTANVAVTYDKKDAALIASAPSLLAENERLCALLGEAHAFIGESVFPPIPGHAAMRLKRAASLSTDIRAALAAADEQLAARRLEQMRAIKAALAATKDGSK